METLIQALRSWIRLSANSTDFSVFIRSGELFCFSFCGKKEKRR